MMLTIRTCVCFLVLVIASSDSIAQGNNWGIIDDDNAYLQIPKKASLTKSIRVDLPDHVSYEGFVPPVLHQGKGYTTCVAFACGYYLRSAMEAILKPAEKSNLVFSPSYLYEKIKFEADYSCTRFSSLDKALSVMSSTGLALLKNVPYPNCGIETRAYDSQAYTYRIAGYQRLFDPQAENDLKIDQLKAGLAEGFPIVMGFCVPASFVLLGANELWQPTPSEMLAENKNVGHALCIVGYDNARYGGAFRIVNSWGTSWGDNGYCWISYSDLAMFTKYAFQAYPSFSPGRNTDTPGTLAGSIDFREKSGAPMPVTMLSDGSKGYKMTRAYNSGTAFQFFIQTDKQAYVYALGADDRMVFSSLFPANVQTSALLSMSSQIALPGDNKFVRLDNRPGTDYFILLLSDHELNLPTLKKRLGSTPGDIFTRLNAALGPKLPAQDNTRYEPTQAKVVADAHIVPLVIAFDHQ